VAGLRRLTWDGELLDEALVLSFAEGRQLYRRGVVELHCPRRPCSRGAVLRALAGSQGCGWPNPANSPAARWRTACLDLAQVEGLADLIDAETEAQRRQAVRVLSGLCGAEGRGVAA
jgi:tRNA modification GTPase